MRETPPNIQMVTDPKKAKALANQTRIKILQELAANPQSISQLARKLGITPVAVLYHTKKLTAAGFIHVAKTATVNNNLTEKFYQVTNQAYLIAFSADLPTRGPVPPKNAAAKPLIGITPTDIEKTFDLLGLTYPQENKRQIEEGAIELLEKAVEEAGKVQREILSQLSLKLSVADRVKIESAAMAMLPIVLDRLLGKQENVEALRSIIHRLRKNGSV